jgi:AcrR family transcriptional regulator
MKRKRITKDCIIEGAIIIADKKGFKNITLKDIAEYLEIKTPSLYNHISGLEEVYDLLSYKGLESLMSELTNSAVGLSGKDALISMGSAYRKFAKNFPIYYSAIQVVSAGINKSTKELSESIIEILIKVISIYKFTDEKNIHIVRILRSYLHGFTQLEVQSSFNIEIDIDDSFNLGLNAILSGFGI